MKSLLMTLLFLVLAALPAQAGELAWLDLGDGEGVVVSSSGEMLTEAGEYDGLYRLTPQNLPGEALYAARKRDTGLLLMMNGSGEALTQAEFGSLQYERGQILFRRQESCGVMDLSGQLLLQTQYTWMTAIDDTHFFAFKSDNQDDTADTLYLADLSGGETDLGMRIGFGPYGGDSGLFYAYDPVRQAFGFLNASGQWAIEPQYTWVQGFQGEYCLASNDEGIGLIDTQGRWVIAPVYGQLAFCGRDGQFLIGQSTNGMRLISASDFSIVREYPDGSAVVGPAPEAWCALYLEDRIILLDPDGEEACELACDPASLIDLYQGGGYMVLQSGPWGERSQWICTPEGEKILGPYQEILFLGSREGSDYFRVTSFECVLKEFDDPAFNYYAETEGTRRYGIVDSQGSEVLPTEYEELLLLDNGVLALKKQGEWTLTDGEE